MTIPAPEPVEVPAAELAAAEEWARWAAVHDDWDRTRELMGVLLAEYDRRSARITKLEGMVCTCHQGQAMEAQLDRLTARVAELEAELDAEQDAYDELLAESGGVSSPPFEGGPPRGN